MEKSTSQSLKGVAILLMIFYHLFNNIANVNLCDNLLYISGEPLAYILSKATNPVAFFLILGGYGLFKVNEKGDKNRWGRIFKLYIHYWLTLLIFVAIGHFLKPELYPGNWLVGIVNLTGFVTTYNHEMWFLFPYVILSICAPYIFRLYQKFKSWTILIFVFLIYCFTQYFLKTYQGFFYENYWAYNGILVFNLLFNFTLGALAARGRIFEKIHSRYLLLPPVLRGIGVVMIICVLIAIQCVTTFNYFYAFLMTLILALPRIPVFCRKILIQLGNQSMNMWMIHSWFCYYLFHNFIYSFRYPLIIFAVLTIISYLSSFVINYLAAPIESLFLTRKQIRQKTIL